MVVFGKILAFIFLSTRVAILNQAFVILARISEISAHFGSLILLWAFRALVKLMVDFSYQFSSFPFSLVQLISCLILFIDIWIYSFVRSTVYEERHQAIDH